ncbi:GntR family transcriptional regulator [Nonomuraea diastatica]|uniref:GntR family transcriptional regulator n=1 Tax=Nonomuraea diastatica TaxID=1848329 RepID=A0A4R4WRF1_9ACTN|nr:GntR family transcriptional regulator [Nonomuraea diastatica]TDD20095.1 GntR family transcriptional regulator [Nonomuraea diastatica]
MTGVELDRRLRIDPDSDIPLWVQLRTQLEYIIATGELEPGVKLPAVRALAQRLGVAVDTVRQAYDGLAQAGFAETRHGVGTQVTLPARSAVPGNDPWDLRQTAKVDAALLELLADGVTPTVAGRATQQRLTMLRLGLRVSFIGVRASAERYAATLSARLPDGPGAIKALDIEEFRRAGVKDVTHVISLVFHVREVEERLAEQPVRVLPLTSELDAEVFGRIRRLGDGDRIVLVARPATRHSYEALIQERHPGIPPMEFVADDDDDALRRALPDAGAVLHTSAATPLVRRAAPRAELIELRHAPSERSLDQVLNTLRTDGDLMLRLQRSTLQ